VGEKYGLWSSSLCSFLHSPVTSFLLGTKQANILNNTRLSSVRCTVTCRFVCCKTHS
jgi:hypothetical protein